VQATITEDLVGPNGEDYWRLGRICSGGRHYRGDPLRVTPHIREGARRKE